MQVPFREAANELVVQKTLLSGLDCLLVELTSNNRLIELNEWVCYDVTIGRDLTTAVHVVSISNDENREVDSYYSRKFPEISYLLSICFDEGTQLCNCRH